MIHKTDHALKAIQYTLARDVAADEELTIYYGPHARFSEEDESEEETLDGYDGINSSAPPSRSAAQDNKIQEALSAAASKLALDDQVAEHKSSKGKLDVSPPSFAGEEPVHILFKDLPCAKVSSCVSLADLPLTTGKSSLDHCAQSLLMRDCSGYLGGRLPSQECACGLRVSHSHPSSHHALSH